MKGSQEPRIPPIRAATHLERPLLSPALTQWKLPTVSAACQEKPPQNIANEQRLVAANRELIERFEQKIATTLARIWGEEPSAPAP